MRIGTVEYSRSELEKRVGNVAQLGGTSHYVLSDGRSKGVRAIDVNTGGGFRFTVLPDRGLDISTASYNDINLVFLTPNGEVNPVFYESRGSEWIRTFFGGMLTTCGLTTLGAPGRDGDEELGLHGRYSNTPASRVRDLSRWEGDNYLIEIQGIVEECSVFGPKLRLTRTITSAIGEKSLVVEDVVQNFGFTASPFTILYHINPGFPLLDEGTYLRLTSKEVDPYDKESENHLDSHLRFTAPQTGFLEQNFFHIMIGDEADFAHVGLINKKLDLGLYLKIKSDTLPYVSEWKMLGEGDYVVGLEPCNTRCLNRQILRDRDLLPILKPQETRRMRVEIGVLSTEKEIADFETKINTIMS